MAFEKLVTVYHYSWFNLRNKVNQFAQNWDKQWNVLYQKENVKRFPEATSEAAINKLVEKLYKDGGEESDPVKYKFKLEHSHPAIMKDWIAENTEKAKSHGKVNDLRTAPMLQV